jgi:hypothetical protein
MGVQLIPLQQVVHFLEPAVVDDLLKAVPLFRVLLQDKVDQMHGRERNILKLLYLKVHLLLFDAFADLFLRVAEKGHFPGQHLVENDPYAPDIRLLEVDAFALFRGGVVGQLSGGLPLSQYIYLNVLFHSQIKVD